MLSFDPNKPFADVNLGLDDTFAAQQSQANQAQLFTDEQFKRINQVYDPSNNLATQRAAANAAGNVPQLRFGGESFAEGLGNGINNFYAMRGYGQQQQGYKDIMAQQQAYQQKQVELMNQQVAAQAARENQALAHLESIDPKLAALYRVSGPEGRAQLLAGAGTHQNTATFKPIIMGAEEGGNRLVRTLRHQEFGDAPIERNGIPIPGRLTQYQEIFGNAPVTTVDVNKDVIANQQAAAGLQKTTNELSVQPVQLQQEIEAKNLEIEKKRVENQFIEQEKALAIRLDQIREKQGSEDYNKTIREQKLFQQGRQLFKQLQDSGAIQSSDPAKQAEMQAQLGIYGIKYNPPNSSFQTVKRKDGTIYMLDKNTGQLGKLEKDGTVKTWQDLQL